MIAIAVIFISLHSCSIVLLAIFIILCVRSLWWYFPGGPAVKTVLPLQGARVRSLARELRSHMPCGAAKKEKKRSDHFLRDGIPGMLTFLLSVISSSWGTQVTTHRQWIKFFFQLPVPPSHFCFLAWSSVQTVANVLKQLSNSAPTAENLCLQRSMRGPRPLSSHLCHPPKPSSRSHQLSL